MLLVDYGETERLVPDRILDERMRSYDYADAAVSKALEQRAPLLLRGAARQQGAAHTGGLKVLLYVGIMLICKHFRRRHDAGLIAVSYGDEAAQHGNHRLAGTHIPLKQAVHLVAAGHIGPYLLYHPLLGAGERIRQGVVAGSEGIAHLRHAYAVLRPAAHVALF